MNKLDVRSPILTVSTASAPRLQPARRLIVLVPESEIDTALMARKIWELANALESRVQFLGLSKDAAHESSLRRQVATLSAMIKDDRVAVESKIESGNNWLNMVKSNWSEGDVIVCSAEQQLGFTQKPLSQILESNFNATVYVLAGIQQQENRQYSNWILNTIMWAGSIGIIFGFCWLQSKITQLSKDWAYSALLYISLFIEVGMLWMWNSLFNSDTGK